MIVAIIIIIYASVTKSKKQQELETFYSSLSDADIVKYNNDTKKKLDEIESTLKSVLGTTNLDTAMSNKIDPIMGKINQISSEFKTNNVVILTGAGVPTYNRMRCGELVNRSIPSFSNGANLTGVEKIVDFLATKMPEVKDKKTNNSNKESMVVFGLNAYQLTMDILCNSIKSINKGRKDSGKGDPIESENCTVHRYGMKSC